MDADEDCIGVNDVRSRRCQNIDGSFLVIRVRRLHVRAALATRVFRFRKMSVDQRRIATVVRVEMEQRRINRSQKQRSDSAASDRPSHPGILMNAVQRSQRLTRWPVRSG